MGSFPQSNLSRSTQQGLIAMRFCILFALMLTTWCYPAEQPVDVPDPFGLGERLAILDYLHGHERKVPENPTLEQLRDLYRISTNTPGPVSDEAAFERDRCLRLRTAIQNDFGVIAHEDATESELISLVAKLRKIKEQGISGTFDVARVIDGDSIFIPAIGEIRLDAIDAPELSQEWGTESAAALRDFIGKQPVTIKSKGIDQYGRTLSECSINGLSLNHWMVENGHAWVYRQYSSNADLLAAEAQARGVQRGLWHSVAPTAPWDYRTNQRAARAPPVLTTPGPADAPKGLMYWLNTKSGVRHRSGCRYFADTKEGRLCSPTEGRACLKCGG